ncbi:hypothetical protein B484DRAFT_451462 [Ochromonadaceae sp. CCMP2298]|nr:hypothetical protein B484DRAFT_451462 [Ochromonadaceae sp. CCMP2298]
MIDTAAEADCSSRQNAAAQSRDDDAQNVKVDILHHNSQLPHTRPGTHRRGEFILIDDDSSGRGLRTRRHRCRELFFVHLHGRVLFFVVFITTHGSGGGSGLGCGGLRFGPFLSLHGDFGLLGDSGGLFVDGDCGGDRSTLELLRVGRVGTSLGSRERSLLDGVVDVSHGWWCLQE